MMNSLTLQSVYLSLLLTLEVVVEVPHLVVVWSSTFLHVYIINILVKGSIDINYS